LWYLRRKADGFLEEWKAQKGHLPLVIRGARQVGKTETIRKFAQGHYASLVEINFVTTPAAKRITDNGYSAEEIIRLLSLIPQLSVKNPKKEPLSVSLPSPE